MMKIKQEVRAGIQLGDSLPHASVSRSPRQYNCRADPETAATMKPARRSQLKGKEGNLLGPKQELEALRQYASQVFSAHAPLLPLQGPLPSLDVRNLDQHIHSIKPGKAVPDGSAPAASWRLCSRSLASAMIRHLEGRQAESGLDEGSINADLCLIPKPGKPADKPSTSGLSAYFVRTLRAWPEPPENHFSLVSWPA